MADAAGGPPRLEYPAEGRATITLARPAQLNRLHREDLHVLQAHCATLAARAQLRVVVLQAEGRLFCAGFNLDELGSGGSAAADDPQLFEHTVNALEALPVPTIARLHGGVYGGATDLALACDFRIGSNDLQLRMPAARIGLHYYPGGLRRYVTRLGLPAAQKLFLTAMAIDSDEMLRIGFLTEAVPAGSLPARVEAYLEAALQTEAGAVRAMKRHLGQVAAGGYDELRLRQATRASLASPVIRERLAQRLAGR